MLTLYLQDILVILITSSQKGTVLIPQTAAASYIQQPFLPAS